MTSGWWHALGPGPGMAPSRWGRRSDVSPTSDLPPAGLLSIPRPVGRRPGRRDPGAVGPLIPARSTPQTARVGKAARYRKLLTPWLREGGSVSLEGLSAAEPWMGLATPPPEREETDSDQIPSPYSDLVSLTRRLALLLQLPVELILSPSGPIEWAGQLFQYQLEGVQALLSRDALLLADEMGLGKTVQAIAALRILALRRELERVLVVVPAGLIAQWRRELDRWAPELRVSTVRGSGDERAWQWATPAHVYLVGYETLRMDSFGGPQASPVRKLWDLVMLDEAQKIKNRGTDVAEKCKRLLRRRAWALTGTPLENSPQELASVLEFVAPLLPRHSPARLQPGPELVRLHAGLQLRRRKRDVLADLPPKLVSDVTVTLTGAQRDAYERVERAGIVELRRRGEALRVENVLELIVRLKQICNFCPVDGRSAKMEELLPRLEELREGGARALVFSQFADATFGAAAIARQLAGFNPLLYTGSMSLAERDAVVREFREDPSHRVLVLSLRAGGQGLNLQDASYVFHFDRWWNPAVERQAEDRSHRLGQSMPVNVYRYVCEGTIEERIAEVLRDKQLLFDQMVDDVSLDLQEKLSAGELFDLFGLASPQP